MKIEDIISGKVNINTARRTDTPMQAVAGDLLLRRKEQSKSPEPTQTKNIGQQAAIIMPKGILPTAKKKGIFESAFDEENYIAKLKRGDIGGAVANFVGSGVQAGQSLLMNLSNNIDSVISGEGAQPFRYNMTFSDYEDSVTGRHGGISLTERLSEVHPVLGGAYNLGMEVVTDPLNLIDGAGALKSAGLKKAGSAAYVEDLAKAEKKFLPTASTRKTAMPDEKGRARTGKTESMPQFTSKESLGSTGDRFYMDSPRVLPGTSKAERKTRNTILGLPAPKPQTLYVNPKGIASAGLTDSFIQGRRAFPVENAADIRVAADFARQNGTTLKELPDVMRKEVELSVRSAVEGIVRQLTEYSPKGVDIAYLPSESRSAVLGEIPVRISNNDPLYSMFYKAYGHAPTKETAREFAEKLVDDELKGGAKYFLDDKTVADYEAFKFIDWLSKDIGDDFIGVSDGMAVHGRETFVPTVDYSKAAGQREMPFMAYRGETKNAGGREMDEARMLSTKNQGVSYLIPDKSSLSRLVQEDGVVWLKDSPMNQVDPADYRAFAKSYASKNYVTKYDGNGNVTDFKPITIASDGRQVIITQKGINDVSEKIRKGSKAKEYADSLLVLDDILAGSKKVSAAENRKGRVNPYSYYEGFFKGETSLYRAEISIKDTPDIGRYHYHNLLPEATIKIEPMLDETSYLKGGPNLIKHGSNNNITPVVTPVNVENSVNSNRFKDLGADTNRIKFTMQENVDTYGKMKPGEQLYDSAGNQVTRNVDVPRATAYGENQQYARTLLESQIVDDDLFNLIDETLQEGFFARHTKRNAVAVDQANRILKGGVDSAMKRFKAVQASRKQTESVDIALGNRVLQELQKQGRYQEALGVAGDLSIMLSETGRTLQAARIAKRLSPEGRLQMLKRAALKIEEKTENTITISDETAERISKAVTEREIAEANKDAFIEMWDQVPADWMDKMNAWRYMSMLTNPKTHIRNMVGNAIFVPARELKNVIGAGLERVAGVQDRTKAILTPKDKGLLEFATEDFKKVEPLLKNEGKYDDGIRKLEARVYKPKWLENLRLFNMNLLDKEDTIFMEAAYKSSLAQWMKANKISPSVFEANTVDSMKLLEKGREYAMREAQKATYRDINAFSSAISRTKKTLMEKPGVLPKAGSVALEAAMPFTKTPVNILRRGLEYSPLGFVKGMGDALVSVRKGKMTAAQALDEISAGLTGTGVLLLGMFLTEKGLVRSTSDARKGSKEEDFERMQGQQNYSLQIGGVSYTIDWAAPLSMPFFVGSEMQKMFSGEGADFGQVLDGVIGISDPMFNLSMLQGINEMVKTGYGEQSLGQVGVNAITGYASQFVPTFFGQVARTIDDTRRTTTSTAENATTRQGERFGRQMRGKIPGASMLNEPYVDLWGREDVEPNILKRGVENFLSPGYMQENKTTSVDQELMALAEQMEGEGFEDINVIYPRKTGGYAVTADKVEYRMTEKELARFQRVRGQTSYKRLEELFRKPAYKEASLEEKKKLIVKTYDSAFEVAKSDFFAGRK